MTPVAALERVMHCLDRAHERGFKVKAFAGALETVRATPDEEIRRRAANNTLKELPGIGDATARLITETLNGANSDEPSAYLAKVEAETDRKSVV